MIRRWKPLSILVLLGGLALLPLLQACTSAATMQADPVQVEEPDDEEDEES